MAFFKLGKPTGILDTFKQTVISGDVITISGDLIIKEEFNAAAIPRGRGWTAKHEASHKLYPHRLVKQPCLLVLRFLRKPL
jgi:hypothetical protein